jgi:16S rRNA (cytosine1402-N4)-methyltransferase
MPRPQRSTLPGQHRPVLLDEVLETLDPRPGEIVVDCTVGWAGHAVELFKRVGPTGLFIGLDLDRDNLPHAEKRLAQVGYPFHLHHANFAGVNGILASHGLAGADMVLADLGMSSMQVDDPERGFSYVRDGPLDMRMDRTRGRGAAELLATITEQDLRTALSELGDEPAAGPNRQSDRRGTCGSTAAPDNATGSNHSRSCRRINLAGSPAGADMEHASSGAHLSDASAAGQ